MDILLCLCMKNCFELPCEGISIFKLYTESVLVSYRKWFLFSYFWGCLCGLVTWFMAADLRSRVRFPALPDFLSSFGSGTGSTQPREDKWGATWKRKYQLRSWKPRLMDVGVCRTGHRRPFYLQKVGIKFVGQWRSSVSIVHLRTKSYNFVWFWGCLFLLRLLATYDVPGASVHCACLLTHSLCSCVHSIC
jgi:hypothetical protein